MSSLARQHGQAFERYIKQECRDLRDAGLALVRKNWMAPQHPDDDKDFRIAKSKPDFSGVLDGGRAVVFEAKATLSETSWPFKKLADHQADHLEQAHELGAVAFVYILDGQRRKWVVPWPAIRQSQINRASLAFEQWPGHQKYDGETWLDTLQRLEVA